MAHHGNAGPTSDSFVGKGPKNWQRSDERIKDEVCERLCRSSSIDASEVSVEVENGTVKLEGTVVDRSTKHAIEDLVNGVIGVKDIENRVRVDRNGLMEMANAGRGSTRSDTMSE